jgi:type I restriction enzyme M protein
LSDDEHASNNLPDVLARWTMRDGAELARARTEQSFCVLKSDIVAEDYDLSINRYKEVVSADVAYPPPAEIILELEKLEDEIRAGIGELKGMLG